MNTTPEHNAKIAKLTFAAVYPLYIKKVNSKGRTIEELNEIISWLTGFTEKEIQDLIKQNVTFDIFFQKAKLHANANLINGLICGYRIEELQNPLTQKVRYLDKLIDELAKGKKMEKILRTNKTT
jgi:hypothetical protein